MQRWLIIGAVGYSLYWLMTRGKQKVQAIAAPAQTTGAPQPQPVQATVEPIANAFNLEAYPMGTFVARR